MLHDDVVLSGPEFYPSFKPFVTPLWTNRRRLPSVKFLQKYLEELKMAHAQNLATPASRFELMTVRDYTSLDGIAKLDGEEHQKGQQEEVADADVGDEEHEDAGVGQAMSMAGAVALELRKTQCQGAVGHRENAMAGAPALALLKSKRQVQ